MPLTAYGDQYSLQKLFGNTDTSTPSTYYLSLHTVNGVWQPSASVSSGDIIIPTTFNSLTGSTGRIFVADNSGTSDSVEPIWPTTIDGQVVDNDVLWIEMTSIIGNTYYVPPEVPTLGSAYARQPLANAQGVSQWIAPSQPTLPTAASTYWGSEIDFSTATTAWGNLAVFGLYDDLTAGNLWAWGCLNSYLVIGSSGIQVIISTPSGITISLS
jgi:hypothetical protein